MASGERRLGTFRRGMTVLGKIPTPSVPKPINLPSQRLENQGLESSVEIVPRGTFSWGSAGNSSAAGDNKAGASGIIPLPPTSTGVWNGGIKVQDYSTSGDDVGCLVDHNRSSSSPTGTRPLSAPTITTTSAWGSNGKTQPNVHMQSSGFTVIPMESATPVSKASADSLRQHNDSLLNQPTSANATCGDLEKPPHPGAGSAHVSCPEGWQGHGDDQRTFVRQGTPPTGSELPVGVAMYPGPLPHEAYFRSFGTPHFSTSHDRDMLLVRTLDNPGVYESYQAHSTASGSFSQSNLHESYTSQLRHVEQFATLGNYEGSKSGNMRRRMGCFPSGNKLLFQETEIFCDSGRGYHKYGDGNFGSVPRDQGYFGSHINADADGGIYSMPPHGNEYRNEYHHRRPRNFRRENRPKEAKGFVKEEASSSAMQVPEKKIILLTKTPRDEVERADILINSTFLPDCEGSKSCEQETALSNLEVKNQSTENLSFLFKGNGVKTSEEFFEGTKVHGSEMRRSAEEITKLQIVEENPLSVEIGMDQLQSAGMNTLSCTEKQPTLTASSGDERDTELKVQAKHDVLIDADCHHGKSAKRTRKVAISGSLGPVGGHPVCKMPAKQIVAEGLAQGDDQRLKIKATNHKSERAWRPKSPLVESAPAGSAASPQVARGEKMSERNCRKAMVGEEPSQECSSDSMNVTEVPSFLQSQKAHQRRNMHCFTSSLSSGSNSKVEASSLLIGSIDQQFKTSEAAVDQPTECVNESSTLRETFSTQACNNAGSVSEHCNTEGFNFVETGSDRKAKGRPSYTKAEKEWRPKSPAVEIMSVTDSISKGQAEANNILLRVSENEMKNNHNLKIIEEEGPQALDAYDYEGQRARMKEIAAQRAKQRRKEEEERARERKAKALAKLEELDRRKLTNSTSIEVLMDEAPNRKTKKRLDPPRDLSVLDLEKQQSDEALIWDPSQFSTPAPPIAENKEVAINRERVVHNSRNKTDGFDRSSLKVEEENKVHEPVSAASTSQAEWKITRKDSSMHHEGLSSAQHLESGSLSGEIYGVNKDEVPKLGRSRKQKGAVHNQAGHTASNSGNGRKSVPSPIEGHKELKLSPLVSQFGNRCQVKAVRKGVWTLQSSADELKESNIGELLALEEQPLALCVPDKNSGFCLSRGNSSQQQPSAGESRHKQGVDMETKFTVEQTESIAMSNDDFVVEKAGRLHASWRQKNLSESQFFLNSAKSNSVVVNKGIKNGLEENLGIQSKKSCKVGKGGKQLSHVQKGRLHLEGCDVEGRMIVTLGSVNSELTHLNATCDLKNEEEMVAAEQVKDGQSCDSWRRQKNGKTASRASRQSFLKESNARHSAHLGPTDEVACQEIVDCSIPFAVSVSQTSCPHNLKVNAKLSPKGAFGASQWHKGCAMKPASKPAPLLGEQTGSQPSLEEPVPSWLPIEPSSQHSQELEQNTANRHRRRGLRFQAEAKPPLETSTTNPKHQQETHLMKGAEVGSDPFVNVKYRFSHSNLETRTVSRQHHAGFWASRPNDHKLHEAVSGEQHPSSRGNKLSRQRQINGCSTIAELDRREAEPAIKTGVSY